MSQNKKYQTPLIKKALGEICTQMYLLAFLRQGLQDGYVNVSAAQLEELITLADNAADIVSELNAQLAEQEEKTVKATTGRLGALTSPTYPVQNRDLATALSLLGEVSDEVQYGSFKPCHVAPMAAGPHEDGESNTEASA